MLLTQLPQAGLAVCTVGLGLGLWLGSCTGASCGSGAALEQHVAGGTGEHAAVPEEPVWDQGMVLWGFTEAAATRTEKPIERYMNITTSASAIAAFDSAALDFPPVFSFHYIVY